MDRTCEGDTCSTCSKCVRCKLGLCTGRRWEKDFGGCRKCIHCARCVACWCDEDSEIFQLHEQSVADIPKTLEFDGIKELGAQELRDDQPRIVFVLQRDMSVHRKFCMKMPSTMSLETEGDKHSLQ